MKKIVLLLLAVSLVGFYACNKEEEKTQAESSFEFVIEKANFFKGTADDVPTCADLNLDYAVFELGGVSYTTDLYTVEGELLTEVIKLPVGLYQLTSFLVYNNNGTPNNLDDDILVRAAPATGSDYADLVTNKLDLEISVDPFKKKQFAIDVLCFEDLYYDSFGFTWFEINDIKIERACFFGDICTGCFDDFAGSLYANQENGIQMDMPAIFQVKVYREGETEPMKTFDNTAWLGEGSCTEVYWPNNLNEEDNFIFELWVYLPVGNDFDYVLINSWDVQDENGPQEGSDGVVDFVLGGCQYQNSDYNFEYWMNLPNETFTMTTGSSSPGVNGTYFDIELTGIAPGFKLDNESYGIFCADLNHNIALGTTYTGVSAYNSLSNTLPDNFPLTADEIVFVNYFFNHIPDYIPGWSYDNPTNSALVQDVIWGITDAATFTPTGDALTILNMVMANGAGYKVPPGGYAGIIFWGDETDPQVQLIFSVVDPCE